MNMIIILFFYIFLQLLQTKITDEINLKNYLFNTLKYDSRSLPTVIPVNTYIQVKLISILQIDIQNNQVKFKIELLTEWEDSRLTWDPNLYGNITSFSCPSEQEALNHVWIPDFQIYESNEIPLENLDKNNVNINYQGKVEYRKIGMINMNFDVNVYLYPFDEQLIKMTITSWRYNNNQLNAIIKNPGLYVDSNYKEHVTWSILKLEVIKTIRHDKAGSNEIFGHLYFYIHIKRNGKTIKNTLMIPTICIAFLSLLYYFFPEGNWSRIEFISTLMISEITLLMILTTLLPISSEMPILEELLSFIFIYLFLLLAVVFVIDIQIYKIKNALEKFKENYNKKNEGKSPTYIKKSKFFGILDDNYKNNKAKLESKFNFYKKLDFVVFVIAEGVFAICLIIYIVRWFQKDKYHN